MLPIIVCFIALGITFSQETTEIPTFQQFKEHYNIQYSTETQDNFRKNLFQENITKLRNNPCETCGVTKFFVATYQEIKARKGLILHQFVSASLKSWREHLRNPASKFQFKFATTESGERQIQTFSKEKQKIFPGEYSEVKEKNKGDSKVQTGGSTGKKIVVLKSMNWRDHNVVTAAGDQGSCGSDSAFVAASLCESELILQGKAFNNDAFRVDLSEQYLLKCTVGNDCNGGYLENAIDKTIVSGLPYEKDFQYNPSITQKGICHAKTVLISNRRRRSRYFVNSDYRILKQLRNGPVGVALSADGWEMYAGGVYKCPPNPEINHAATIVGYDETAWIVKNSWGEDFGSDGYIYISRDYTDMQNCGIGVAIHWISEISLEVYLGVALLILLSY